MKVWIYAVVILLLVLRATKIYRFLCALRLACAGITGASCPVCGGLPQEVDARGRQEGGQLKRMHAKGSQFEVQGRGAGSVE